jgi:gas vesicle protein
MRMRWLLPFIGGLFIGLAVGSLAALLVSPATGADTRRAIRLQLLGLADVAKNVADRAESAADYLGEQVERALGGEEEVAWRKVREIREGVQSYSDASIQ